MSSIREKHNPIHMAGPWITDLEVDIVNDAMLNGWYDHPYDYVEKFQAEFAAYHGRQFGVMTPNCTTAIHLLLSALNVGLGDEVIVPECTWIASAAPINYLNATPVFCDIDKHNWCMDPIALERCITNKTKAIIVVDLYGNMPNWDGIQNIASAHGIPVIEDAAEALGSKYKGSRAGSFGVGSVFSFHRTKTLTTGEGGMLLIDDPELYKHCMIWRDHGRDGALPPEMRDPDKQEYLSTQVTFKYMPFNVQAALGYAQFKRIEELIEKKRWILHEYKERLENISDIYFNEESDEVYNGVWCTALVIGKRYNLNKKQIIDTLREYEVPSRPFFYPLSSLPAYDVDKKKYKSTNPVAYDVSDRGINLSCAMNLTDDQIDHICNGIKQMLGHV